MDRCALCPGVNTPLPAHGRGDILFIGEAPGVSEEKLKCVFVGKTGDEVNDHYLLLAGLRRDRVVMCNAIACMPVSTKGKVDLNNKKDAALLECCANQHLYPLIERMRPRVIVTLGAFAAHAIHEGIDLELEHGIPTMSHWGIPVFPMYHPASGMHEPKKMTALRTDWIRFGKYLKGQLQTRVDDYPEVDYQEVTEVSQLYDLDPTQPLAGDTESKWSREERYTPYCLTYSDRPGWGRLIRAERTDLLEAFQEVLDAWEGPFLWHNWTHDRPVTRKMGLRYRDKQVVDTMALIFHLGNLPQGLKAIAFRELGMAMQDFEDLVKPYSQQQCINYLLDAYTNPIAWDKPEPQMVRDEEGLWKIYRAQSMGTKLKRFFTDLRKNPKKDVFEAWENWESHWAEIEAKAGPWPGMSIEHAPFNQVLAYACRDADALRRLHPVLLQMRSQVRKRPQQEWRAA